MLAQNSQRLTYICLLTLGITGMWPPHLAAWSLWTWLFKTVLELWRLVEINLIHFILWFFQGPRIKLYSLDRKCDSDIFMHERLSAQLGKAAMITSWDLWLKQSINSSIDLQLNVLWWSSQIFKRQETTGINGLVGPCLWSPYLSLTSFSFSLCFLAAIKGAVALLPANAALMLSVLLWTHNSGVLWL